MKGLGLLASILLVAGTMFSCSNTPAGNNSSGGGSSSSSSGGAPTYNVSATFQVPTGGAAAVAHRTNYIKLVASTTNLTGPTLYSAIAIYPASGGTSGTVSGITNGNYGLYMFIDTNMDANLSAPAPDSGDYVYTNAPITISADISPTVLAADWLTVP